MEFENNLAFAKKLDVADPLRWVREKFIIPQDQIYFLGNSLGLQPKAAKKYIDQVMNDWGSLGVESFLHAPEPWIHYHDKLIGPLAKIVGALPQEVVVMNQLTVNLHLMLVSFYQPLGKRNKIICEAKAFPSDQYMFETHVRHHGLDPNEVIIEVHPREGEHCLRTEDVLATIEKNKEEIALVLFGGINYYTGQVQDMKAITDAAKAVGAKTGFDLAHAAGNIALHLHDWDVDFACWCSYKYLNAGPGAVGGVFIHEKHHTEKIKRFAGWWGYDLPARFKMEKGFKPMPGAEGWQLSTPAFFLFAAHRAALEVVEEAGWENVLEKQKQLTAWLWFLLNDVLADQSDCQVITPGDETQRGCQVSLLFKEKGREVYDALMQKNIIVDWREPGVIRLAPVPLYNTFEEIWLFAERIKIILKN